jgi:methionyl-tRNA formyltransferase
VRFTFMGTPAFAATALEALAETGAEIAAVYTRPPQPAGRGRKETRSPVHEAALARGLAVRTPKGFSREDVRADYAALKADAAIVVAYGVILPQAVLDMTRLGAFNIHASLLPCGRGAAPIQRAIMAGDAETGVEIMKMEAGLDTGPVALSRRVPIRDDDTAASLNDRLAAAGAALLKEFVGALERGDVRLTPQAREGVTYAAKISSAEARIDWTRPAAAIDRQIRGLSPYPGAWFEADAGKGSERVKALLSRKAEGAGAAGTVLDTQGRLVVAAGEGAVELLTVQRAGRAGQDAAAFLRGFPLRAGDRLR